MTKNELLRQVRGSFTNYQEITVEFFKDNSDGSITYEEFKNLLNEYGLDIGKIIVDPERKINNIYYADMDRPLYMELYLTKELLLEERFGLPTVEKRAAQQAEMIRENNYSIFYLLAVPKGLHIYDFQKRCTHIPDDKVFEVWSDIHRHLDYANGQWSEAVLEYVFSKAPPLKELPELNENGTVTIYRGVGSQSQPLDTAISWSTNHRNALWFANHNGLGTAVYKAEVSLQDIIAWFPGIHNENEIIVKKGSIMNIQKEDYIPVDTDNMTKVLAPALMDFANYGKQIFELGYEKDGAFSYHGRSHILRVLLLGMIMCDSSGYSLSLRDRNIIAGFSLLHDLGRTDDGEDYLHGKLSAEIVRENDLHTYGGRLGKKDFEMMCFCIEQHSKPDEDGYDKIEQKKNYSANDRKRLKLLFEICKDIDGLDRVRFGDLDVSRLRTSYAKKLPLIAGALLNENLEAFIKETLELENEEEIQADISMTQ